MDASGPLFSPFTVFTVKCFFLSKVCTGRLLLTVLQAGHIVQHVDNVEKY